MEWLVIVYDFWHNKHEWTVDGESSAKEYAKRIITEGLWFRDSEKGQTFLPVHQIIKVKIKPL